MKISNYTFCFDVDGKEYYLYNSLSNALIELDYFAFQLLKDCQSKILEPQEELFGSELWDELVDKRYVIENDKDELLLLKSIIMNMRAERTFMHLTLAPTMDCNFDCHYCFEKGKRKSYMSPGIMDGIIKYVTSFGELNEILITWFGGEPLMALPQIRLFNKKLKANFQGKIRAEMISTAYFISTDVIDSLKELGISKIQITLDGNKESHNAIKQTQGCDDVFSKIIENIDMITTIAPEINVVVRVNLTKKNCHEYVALYKFLDDRYKDKNLGIAPSFVKNKTNDSNNDQYFNHNERSHFILDLFSNKGVYSSWLQYPRNVCHECAIRGILAVGVDPEGYAYKCWEVIGEPKYAIGKINSDGEIVDINHTVLNRQLYGADPFDDKKCSKCSYLPICHGGCPIERIQNEFENGKNEICHPYKGFLSDFMKIHLSLRRNGFSNK